MFGDRIRLPSNMPQRPRPSEASVDLNSAHSEMSTMRGVYNLLKSQNPDARQRIIDYVTKLLEHETQPPK